uniref:Uncharacterized protein n=1 Tax=Clytia hemisphaerica TaxID=252671 RepID=A0A7M5XEI1_9CNID
NIPTFTNFQDKFEMESIESKSMHRRLGHMEHNMLVSNLMGAGIYLGIDVLESQAEISYQHLSDVFTEVSKLNYLMQACIRFEGKSYFFQPMDPTFLLSDWMLIDEISLDRWEDCEKLIPELIETKFDYKKGPLWKVALLKIPAKGNKIFSYMLVTVLSHVICDAKFDANLIFNQVLPLLNGDILKYKPLYFAKAQEQILNGFSEEELILANRPTIPFHFRLIGNIISWSLYLYRSLFGESTPIPLHKHYKSLVIDEQSTKEFISACKAKGKTVHSILMILMYNAINEVNKRFNTKIGNGQMMFPVDLRKFNEHLNEPVRMPMGNYVHIGTAKIMKAVPIDNEESIFKKADELMASIKQYNSPNPVIDQFEMGYVIIEKGELRPYLFDKFPPMTSLSNLGNCDAMNKYNNEDATVTIKNHFFAVKAGSGVFFTANTFNSKLHIFVSSGMKENHPILNEFVLENLKGNIFEFVRLYSA